MELLHLSHTYLLSWSEPQSLQQERALNSGGNYHYEYSLTDHLGNERVSFDTYSGTASSVQTDDYYPFGLEISSGTLVSPKNEYLYNKKELQEELGQYDYGARFYDPVVARWTTIDPLAEKMRRFSPYDYGDDNSIRNIDPDGMETEDANCCGTPGQIQLAPIAVEAGEALVVAGATALGIYALHATITTATHPLMQQDATRTTPPPSVAPIVKTYAPNMPLSRDQHGNAKVDDEAKGVPHTQLGQKTSTRGAKGTYTQGRTFDKDGKTVKDIHHTDHGEPDKHPNPHQHVPVENPTGGTPQHGPAEPLTNN